MNMQSENLNDRQSPTRSGIAVYNLKKSLIVKALIIAAIVLFALMIVYVIRRYFYILDAYVYTGEFHLLFIKNNLHAAKLEHVTEYFRPMSFFIALPIFMAGTCYVGLDSSSSEHVLMQAAVHAFGGPVSFLFGVLGFFFLGLLSFGIGSLILGDIVPLLMKGRYAGYQVRLKKPAFIFFPLVFALPFVPVVLTAVIGSVSRVPLTRILQCMLVGFIMRTLIEMLI
jgi:hypothetical protein